MSFAQSTRGAVHMAFVIILFILTAAFAAMWFTTNGKVEQLAAENATLKADAGHNTQRMLFVKDCYKMVATALGGVNPEVPEPVGWETGTVGAQDASALGASVPKVLGDAKDALVKAGDAAADPKNMKSAFESLQVLHKKVVDERETALSTVNTMKADGDALRTQMAEADKKHTESMASLTQDKDNQIARTGAQNTELTSQRDEATAANRKMAEEVTKTKDTTNKDVTAAKAAVKQLEGTVNAMKSEVRVARETETPDGKILAVNRTMRTGFVDIGSKDRLYRGCVFKVFETVKGGVKVYKGRIVVTSVGLDRSEFSIDSEQPGTTMGEGDWVMSPIFDRKKATHFTFVGELTGQYTRELAKRILEQNGAVVDDKVTEATDFLVLGVKEAGDAEDPEASAAYKAAQVWGIEVLRSKDLAPFLQQ